MRCYAPALLLACPGALAQWAWVQLPDFPGTARDDAASFTIGDKIYVGTGMEVGWGLTNDWYCYDTNTAIWSAIAPMPDTPRQYAVGFTIEDKGYLFGGLGANGALNDLWCYDPMLDTWIEKAPLPGEGRYACVAADDGWNGQIATGMLSSGMPTNEHWLYNASMDAWFAAAPAPGPARHRASSFTNSSFMVIGGADAQGNALADVWKYDVLFPTGEWVPGPALPAPRYGAKGVPFWDLLIGGASGANTFHEDVWRLVANSTEWEVFPGFEGGPRRGGTTGYKAGPIVNGPGGYFGTGLTNELQRRADWWLLEPPVGMPEVALNSALLYPNPATDHVRPELPIHWPYAECVVRDALGRHVLEQVVLQGSSLDVGGLPAGRYEVLVSHGEERLRAPLIKSP
jgi:hypothetical protein